MAAEPSDICSILALTKLDCRWQQIYLSSIPARCWRLLSAVFLHCTYCKLSGSFLQASSFWVIVLLLLALGAPQFAGDKEGLAFFVAAAAGLRLAGTVLGGKEPYRPTAIDALVIAYLACNLISACASHYWQASLVGLAKLSVYIVAYFVFTAGIGQSRQKMIVSISALVAAGFFVAAYGLYQYKIGVAPLATWEDPSVEVKSIRIYSTLGNPNLLAGYLIPLVPLSFSLAMIAACKKRLYLAAPVMASTAIIALSVVLTGSRGGYIGLAAACSGIALVAGARLWQKGARQHIFLAAIVMLIVFAGLIHFIPGAEQRVASIFAGGEHTSNRYRLNVWVSSLHMLKDNWWLGVGPGNKAFELAYGLYMTTGFDALGTYCVPLEVAVEAGLPALVIFSALLLAALARAHCIFYQTQDPSLRWILAGLCGAMLGLMAHGLVDTVFFRPQVQLIFWMIVAIMVAAGNIKEDNGAVKSSL